MHSFFHYLVAGKMAASQRAYEWTKQVIGTRSGLDRGASASQIQLAEAFSGVVGSVQIAVMLHCDTL
jgi:hypothetical protein